VAVVKTTDRQVAVLFFPFFEIDDGTVVLKPVVVTELGLEVLSRHTHMSRYTKTAFYAKTALDKRRLHTLVVWCASWSSSSTVEGQLRGVASPA
jgi:hypothetical protein